MNFELSLLDQIQRIRIGPLDKLMKLTTHLGDAGIIWIVISVLMLFFKSTRKLGLACLFALLGSLLITNLGLKNLFARTRPYHYRDIALLIKEPHDYSFPSGHTSAAFSVVYILLKERFKIGSFKAYVPLTILASMMAFSRMYLYVHYPSDIIGSLIIAYLCSYIGIKLSLKITKSQTLMNTRA